MIEVVRLEFATLHLWNTQGRALWYQIPAIGMAPVVNVSTPLQCPGGFHGWCSFALRAPPFHFVDSSSSGLSQPLPIPSAKAIFG